MDGMTAILISGDEIELEIDIGDISDVIANGVSDELNSQPYIDDNDDTLASTAHHKNLACVSATLLFFMVFGIWIMQNSVNAYAYQTYHKESPLMDLNDYAMWRAGGMLGERLYGMTENVQNTIASYNEKITKDYNAHYAFTAEYLVQQARLKEQERLRRMAQMAEERRQEQVRAKSREEERLKSMFSLSSEQSVFFAGDSLMQGVAPHVQQALQEKYNLKTINLAKQSTGLSYPSFFDWPKTIRDTLAGNSDVRILVVFLGANDPWDMPNPAGGVYLKFASAEWETVYRERIKGIIDNAKAHDVSVMWLGPPNMKKDSLNKQMVFLSALIADEVVKNGGYFIDSRALLGTSNNVYSDYLEQEGKNVTMRSADGIHFSVLGQKHLAQAVEKQIHLQD